MSTRAPMPSRLERTPSRRKVNQCPATRGLVAQVDERLVL